MQNIVGRKIAVLARLGTSLAAIAAASAVMVPTAAFAQTGTSTLRGHAGAGAEVVATEVNTGSKRETKAGEDGN